MAKRSQGESEAKEQVPDATATPAVEVGRAERMERIAEAIQRGTYKVDAGALSDRLLETMRGRRRSSTRWLQMRMSGGG